MTDLPPWEPPFAGSELEHLVGMLDRLRWTFRWKADGLDAAGLRFQLPTSDLSLGSLLKHLAWVEDSKFTWVFSGTRPSLHAAIPEGVDPDAWAFDLADDDTAEALYDRYDSMVLQSRRLLAEAIQAGGLDRPAHLSFGDIQPSLRRFVCDLVEEYGRHTGHADLIREALDGRVGEDAPQDWRPVSGNVTWA